MISLTQGKTMFMIILTSKINGHKLFHFSDNYRRHIFFLIFWVNTANKLRVQIGLNQVLRAFVSDYKAKLLYYINQVTKKIIYSFVLGAKIEEFIEYASHRREIKGTWGKPWHWEWSSLSWLRLSWAWYGGFFSLSWTALSNWKDKKYQIFYK